jgi:hypothetical protein
LPTEFLLNGAVADGLLQFSVDSVDERVYNFGI